MHHKGNKEEGIMTSASLIIIGTELTRGIIQDKHGMLVSKALTEIGVHMSQIVALPDDGSIEKVLEALMKSNSILIITGGLGPTTDDMTRKVIAEASGTRLVRNEECWQHLLERLGDKAYGANSKQAMIPEGFSVLPNPNGTAPGFYGESKGVLIISLPGPPREMEPMFFNYVMPLIRKHLDIPEKKRNEYSSFITAEAKLEELYHEAAPELDWGTRFQDYRISLYLSGGSEEDKEAAISRLREKVGRYRILDGDVTPLSFLVSVLKEKGATISAAESCSGGLASSLLTSLPGSSSFMMGAVTAYAPSVKESVLGVRHSTIEEHGTVSEECASEMAEGALAATGSDYSFSITGVAGPDKSEGKDVGTVCFAFSGRGRRTESVSIRFTSWGRESIRRRSVTAAFILAGAYIIGESTEEIVATWACL